MSKPKRAGTQAELIAELQYVNPDVEYYALTLTGTADGRVRRSTQTQFVGPGSKPMWELRAASPVHPDKMRAAWKVLGQHSVVVNGAHSLAFFLRVGGNAVIAYEIFSRWFGEMLEPTECAPSRFGEGVRTVADASRAQLQHAPSRKVRMDVLRRDQYRCKACGQRPSDDVNIQLHVHHVRPFGQGGLTEAHNLLTLCHTCHTGLDPHFEQQLLTMIPDGLMVPYSQLQEEGKIFDEAVRRYRHMARIVNSQVAEDSR